MKNYVTFINDHSGSMDHLAKIALVDYNANMQAIADAASSEKLDTIVSEIGIGYPSGTNVTRLHVISNPNVLKPKTSWRTDGGTPLYDGIYDAISLHESLPDYNSPDVSFLVYITTDGRESHSTRRDPFAMAQRIRVLQSTGRWTFIARMPRGGSEFATRIGIPAGNVLEWETSEQGMRDATVKTQAATQTFYKSQSTVGTRSTTSFFTNAAAVNTAVLTDITSEVSLYQVPAHGGRLEIKDFILSKRSKFLKGAAFVQLVKTEPKIGPKKIVLIRERNAPNRIFAGKEARQMIGMPTDPTSNARIHPGEHGQYDIFIQSESMNRLLPDNVGVVYWEKQGVPFTDADIALFAPKAPVAAPAAPVLPAIHGKTKPTPSPVPKAVAVHSSTVDGKPVKWFSKRDDARKFGSVKDSQGLGFKLGGPNNERWFVYL